MQGVGCLCRRPYIRIPGVKRLLLTVCEFTDLHEQPPEDSEAILGSAGLLVGDCEPGEPPRGEHTRSRLSCGLLLSLVVHVGAIAACASMTGGHGTGSAPGLEGSSEPAGGSPESVVAEVSTFSSGPAALEARARQVALSALASVRQAAAQPEATSQAVSRAEITAPTLDAAAHATATEAVEVPPIAFASNRGRAIWTSTPRVSSPAVSGPRRAAAVPQIAAAPVDDIPMIEMADDGGKGSGGAGSSSQGSGAPAKFMQEGGTGDGSSATAAAGPGGGGSGGVRKSPAAGSGAGGRGKQGDGPGGGGGWGRGLTRGVSEIYTPKPNYPEEAEAAGLEGDVWVKVTVDAGGRLLTATVYRSSGVPALDEAALQAVREGRFRPSMKDGQPIVATALKRFTFINHR